jgi:hypothetical protein
MVCSLSEHCALAAAESMARHAAINMVVFFIFILTFYFVVNRIPASIPRTFMVVGFSNGIDDLSIPYSEDTHQKF